MSANTISMGLIGVKFGLFSLKLWMIGEGFHAYYVYFSKTYWNCLFSPLTLFQIRSNFSDIWSRFCM